MQAHSLIIITFLFQGIRFSQTVLFQTIEFIISTVFVHIEFNIKAVLFQSIHLSISTQFSFIRSINRALSDATTPSGPGSDGNLGLLHISQSSSIIGTSPSDYLVSYPCHLLGMGSYPSVELQSVYIPSRLGNWFR